MKMLMRFCSVFLFAAMLAGCGTTLGSQIQQKVAPDLGPDAVKAVQDLKAAVQPIITKVAKDSAATRVWANKYLGPTGTAPDPVKYQLALACPTATDAVAPLINGTLDGLIAQIQTMSAPPDPDLQGGFLMLALTQLKYGPPQMDPKAQLAALQAQVDLQLDALMTGCVHLFPAKQVNDILKLAAKAGITGFSGGSLAPLMGVLP